MFFITKKKYELICQKNLWLVTFTKDLNYRFMFEKKILVALVMTLLSFKAFSQEEKGN